VSSLKPQGGVVPQRLLDRAEPIPRFNSLRSSILPKSALQQVPTMRLGATLAISLFVLVGDIAKAGVSNILGTLSGWPMKKLKAGISLGKDGNQVSLPRPASARAQAVLLVGDAHKSPRSSQGGNL
jgi:hypothetical protein